MQSIVYVQRVIIEEKKTQEEQNVEYKKTWENAKFGGIFTDLCKPLTDLWNAEFEKANQIMKETNTSCNNKLMEIYNIAKQRAEDTPKEAKKIWEKAYDDVQNEKKSKKFRWYDLFSEAITKIQKIENEKQNKIIEIVHLEAEIRSSKKEEERDNFQKLTCKMSKEKKEIEEKQKKAASEMSLKRTGDSSFFGRWDYPSTTGGKYVYHHMVDGSVAALHMVNGSVAALRVNY